LKVSSATYHRLFSKLSESDRYTIYRDVYLPRSHKTRVRVCSVGFGSKVTCIAPAVCGSPQHRQPERRPTPAPSLGSHSIPCLAFLPLFCPDPSSGLEISCDGASTAPLLRISSHLHSRAACSELDTSSYRAISLPSATH